jgi:hypothetical protein
MLWNCPIARRRKHPLGGGLPTRIEWRRTGEWFERLEARQMLATVSAAWIGGASGYWDVAGDWSNDAVPSSATAVSIAQSGATVTIRSGHPASAGSVAIAAGDTLELVGSSLTTAAGLTNSGTLIAGPANTVTIGGVFTQTSTGTLDIQLGGAPASGNFGFVNSAGAASLAGTLRSEIVNGYSPSTIDSFTPIAFASQSGSFSTETLPSGSGYQFNAAVTFTNVTLSAAPTTALSAAVNASASLHAVTTNLLGINTAYWDQDAVTAQTQQMATAAGLDIYRFPGGSAADDFHFNVADNWGDSGAITIPQFLQFIASAGGTGVVTLDYGSGSPQEAAAELAYTDGSATDTTSIGNGIQWNDATGQWQTVNWGTVGYWAALRGASPLAQDDGLNFLRIAHPAPFTGIKYWEIGNEEYGSWEVDHHGTAVSGVSTGATHDPGTYAAFAKQFAALADEIQTTAGLPSISIGIDSGDPTGGSDGNWTKDVLADGAALGFVPGFISDHSYMQAPGAESDSYLLDNTVTDSGSVLDWSTRYADYESVLQQTVGSQASSVQVMATEYNSVWADPGKQSTSLVNGLFVADSLGSLLDSGYSGGFVWDLRNAFDPSQNNSNLLYGWREGGDYGQLGDPNDNSPPTTGPYVAYPGYDALQLASKIIQSGGEVVPATSNYSDLNVYAVREPAGNLELLVINVNPGASLTEQFDLTGFQPGGPAQVWQYGEAQDTAQSQSATGASALAYASTSVSLSGSNFSYTFPAYSMTVLDLSPPPSLSGPTTATVGHTRSLVFTGATAIALSDSAATGSTIDTVALSVHSGTLGVSLSSGATIIAGANGSVSLTLGGTLTQLNTALASLVYTAPTTGTSDTLTAVATDGIASSTPLATTITLTNIAPTLTWSNPANIIYGTALGAAQLDATASVPGIFAYTPASRTVLKAGNTQSLSVTFTPTDTIDYSTVTKSVSINVGRATPTISAADAGGTYDGSPFSATALVAGVVSGVDTNPSASLEGVSPIPAYYAGSTVSGSGSSAAPSAVGTYTVVASFAGSADYSAAASNPVTFAIVMGQIATPGLYNPTSSWWYLRNSNATGAANIMAGYGAPGGNWIPLSGDWTGNGTDTLGLYNPATGFFYLRNSNTTGVGNISFFYGVPGQGWIPVVGDWTGKTSSAGFPMDTVGLYDPKTCTWYLRSELTTGVADITLGYGPPGAGWLPVVGDWDGNGTTTVGLYNPATAYFYLRNSNTTGVGNISFFYGAPAKNWIPVAGDWTGAGHDSIGMYDPATSTWYLRNELSTGVADLTFGFGSPGSNWVPVVGDWSGATSAQAPAALISPADEESTQLASTWPLQTVDPRAVDQLAGSDGLWSAVAMLPVGIL